MPTQLLRKAPTTIAKRFQASRVLTLLGTGLVAKITKSISSMQETKSESKNSRKLTTDRQSVRKVESKFRGSKKELWLEGPKVSSVSRSSLL